MTASAVPSTSPIAMAASVSSSVRAQPCPGSARRTCTAPRPATGRPGWWRRCQDTPAGHQHDQHAGGPGPGMAQRNHLHRRVRYRLGSAGSVSHGRGRIRRRRNSFLDVRRIDGACFTAPSLRPHLVTILPGRFRYRSDAGSRPATAPPSASPWAAPRRCRRCRCSWPTTLVRPLVLRHEVADAVDPSQNTSARRLIIASAAPLPSLKASALIGFLPAAAHFRLVLVREHHLA